MRSSIMLRSAVWLSLLARPDITFANDSEDWVGRDVVIISPDVKPRIGNCQIDVLPKIAFSVTRIDGDSLWVDDGWLRSDEVVPIDKAIEWFTAQIEREPTPFAYVGRAVAKNETVDYDGAYADCMAAIEIDLHCELAYYWRAMARINQRRFTDVIVDCNDAIRLNPKSAMLWCERAYAYQLDGNLHQARRDATEAVRIAPNSAMTYIRRACVYRNQGDFGVMLEDATHAARLDPRNDVAYSLAGTARCSLGDYEAGVRDLTRAIEIRPNHAPHYADRIRIYRAAGQHVQALTDCDTVVRLRPRDRNVLLLRARIQNDLGESEAARQDINRAVALAPDDVAIPYAVLVDISQKEGGCRHAVAALEAMLPGATRTQQVEIYGRLAMIRANSADDRVRDGRKAVDTARMACDLSDGQSVTALEALAAGLAESGDFVAAVEKQQNAIDLVTRGNATPSAKDSSKPDLTELQRRLTLYKSGKAFREESEKHGWVGEKIVARLPATRLQLRNHAVDEEMGERTFVVERTKGDSLWLGQGWVRASEVQTVDVAVATRLNRWLGNSPNIDFDRALHDCDAAVRLSPDNPWAYSQRASIWRLKGDAARADSDLQKSIELAPEHRAEFLMKQAFALVGRGDDARAIEMYSTVLAADTATRYQLTQTYLALATIRSEATDAEIRDVRRAVQEATKACELSRWSMREALSTLAATHAACGEFKQAARWQMKAIELTPEAEEAAFDKDEATPTGVATAAVHQEQERDLKTRLEFYKAGKQFAKSSRTWTAVR
ncbi:MAG TPA: tetratricopeptide repeat protein [Pirellulales bacterium]|nr:tetratricopeptide repeat protein [Pirellulales bacterium]